ncbi:MAG: CRISPR-associated endonuclease Cas2 [Clostridia bacterium]|nr:CRISPR-associated endonuclease Cas2 [Clostridia bacterium]
MRALVFFDLPIKTNEDKRNYRHFRKILIKNGFIMMQKSVYCKLMTTPSVENSIKRLIRENKPPDGIVQMLTVTEKQFSKMEFVIGSYKNDVIDNDNRLVIL